MSDPAAPGDPKTPVGRRAIGRGRTRQPQLTVASPPAPLEPPAAAASESTPTVGSSESEEGIKRGRGRAKIDTKSPATTSEKEGTKPPPSPPGSPDRELEKELEQLQLAERSKFGTAGRPIMLETNHFAVMIAKPQLKVYQYRVEITHPVAKTMNRDDCRILFWKLVNENTAIFPNRYTLAYDGGNTMFSLHLLKFPNGHAVHKFELQSSTSRDLAPVTISVTVAVVVPVIIDMRAVGIKALRGDQNRAPLQFLDIVSRQGRSLLGTGMDREPWYCFGPVVYRVPTDGSAQQALPLGAGRYMWLGMFTASHVSQAFKPLLNIDVSHGTFYYDGTDKNLVRFLEDVLTESSRAQWKARSSTKLNPGEIAIFEKAVAGLRIRFGHRQDPREYIVRRIPRPAAATEVTFTSQDGAEMTVASYFAQRYGSLKYPELPVVTLGSKKRPIQVPIENCVLAFPQRCTRKLSDRQLSSLIRSAAVPAPQRKQKIHRMIQEANFNQDPWLEAFGINIDRSMTKVEGRVLVPPNVEYRPTVQRQPRPVTPHDGAWRIDGQKVFLSAAPVSSYGLVLQRGLDDQAVRAMLENLSREASAMGVEIARQPQLRPVWFTNVSDIESTVTDLAKALQSNKNNLQFIFIGMQAKSTPLYAEIKRVADVITGVMTQCVILKTIDQCSGQRGSVSRQTLQNIILKINAKMGGINNRLVAEGVWRHITREGESAIFLGANVTHPPAFDKRSPSVAAIVSNVDLDATRYSASVKTQRLQRGTVMRLSDILRSRLLAFFTETKKKPDRIIYYRDGLAEGQLRQAVSEIGDIREVCQYLEATYRPKITYIIGLKRHHTRFFCLNKNDERGRGGNIPPGTMVDKEITSAQLFDFYLCSHMGIQGTSRPTRYSVLTDDSRFSADDIQAITFALTHVYCRCARSVSIPAPLYYAYWANIRAKHHLSSSSLDFDSDTISVASASGAIETISEDQLKAAVSVHERMTRSMYFV